MFVISNTMRSRAKKSVALFPRPSSLVPASLTQLHAREHARLQLAVAIGELGFDREGTRGRIDDASPHRDFALEYVPRTCVDVGLHIRPLMNPRNLLFRSEETELERRGLR